MTPSCASPMLHISYWEFFQKYYTPLLKEMDLTLKTLEAPVSVTETARILAMRPETVEEIMCKEEIKQIDQEGFLRIVMHGNSSLCRLLQRECNCGSPEWYSPSHIAYIYGLQDKHVESVCRESGYTEVPAQKLPELLSKIYIYIV